MIRGLGRILAAAICLTLAGCGAQGDEYQPRTVPASQSLIYLYRPFKFLSSQSLPLITCGHESIELDAGGFHEFLEDSGTITCAVAGDSTADYKFDAHVGEQYFIKVEVDANGLNVGVRLVQMDPDVGRDEIKDCREQGIKQ